VSVDNKVLDELKQLLLDFGSITDGDVCSLEEFISIPAEEWTEAPESDDDECQLALALAESDELTAAEACNDDSEEVKIMTLMAAKAASAALMLFLEENKCAASLESQKQVSTQLSRMTFTARTTQASIPSCFKQAGLSLVNIWSELRCRKLV
jgi:hypothetical protein